MEAVDKVCTKEYLMLGRGQLSSGNRPSGQADGFTLLLNFGQAALVSETDILSSLRVFPNPVTDWLQLLQLPAATSIEAIVEMAETYRTIVNKAARKSINDILDYL